MFSILKFSSLNVANLVAATLIAVLMVGCAADKPESGEELFTCDSGLVVSSAGDTCVEPEPISCPVPTIPNAFNDGCEVGLDPNAPTPTVFPNDDQAVLYYNRANRGATNAPGDPQYDGYVLHTWNDAGGTCDAYAPPHDAAIWGQTLVFDGIDPNYGAYWILNLKPDHTECGNFIIHVGTDEAGKEMGGSNKQMSLVQDDETYQRVNFTISGYPDPLEYPITDLGPQPLGIVDAAAHWLDTNTLVWDIRSFDLEDLVEMKLHHSATAGITADLDDNLNGTAVVLTAATQSDELMAQYPLTASWATFTTEATADEVKAILKGELVLAAYDVDGKAYKATRVQAAKVLDALYTAGENDADEAALGVVYNGSEITANLWAPTAQSVSLKVYDAAKELVSTNTMTEDPLTGIWSFTGDSALDRQFFKYEIVVYHPQNKAIETIDSTDPYSVSLSTNGNYSQFVNLSDADLKPEGWDGHTVATIVDPEDAVIYEGHIRDFSVRDESTTEENRGKYMAFTELASSPMTHLSELVTSGMTHFHMLPANDIATINEDLTEVVNLDSTVAEFCAINDEAPVCGVESDDATLLSVFESYPKASEEAQELAGWLRGYDSFNWGYDPKHFNVPEGSYASSSDGVARIIEMRAMNKALHDTGLRVVLDVVYNHTNSSGLYDNSVFDKIVPGYYHRLDLETGNVERSTCCDDTELDHVMMNKFMVDSLKQWTTEYGFDGFRFDIMSHGSKEQMLAARDAVRVLDPDNYFYGEGWYRDNGRTANQANQGNMAGTEVSTFNDRLRDAVRGKLPRHSGDDNVDSQRIWDSVLFSGTDDDVAKDQMDIIRLGMAGTLADYVLKSNSGTAIAGSSFNPSSYAADPADVINYVSKHDDSSLWDQLQFNLPFEMSLDDRVRSQVMASAIPLMSQGIPFLQMGNDLLRSKSMDKNSYDSGDWFNYIDFTMGTNNWNMGLPLANDNSDRWYTTSVVAPDDVIADGNEDAFLALFDKNLSISALSASPFTQVSSSEIMSASAIFKEFLSIRRDSKLFRLTTADDVFARVGFHNIGRTQSQGLIVMSIDDGTDLADLDPATDAIVVVVNGSDSEKSHEISTASGFELHATQLVSADSRVASSSFAEDVETGIGTFTVPAKTMAIFVKPQGASQGEGLSAFATSGAPDVVPYGDEPIFLRGEMNGWGEADEMEYKGGGVYQALIELTAETSYNFKVASSDWSTVDFGAVGGEEVIAEDEQKSLVRAGGNMNFTSAESVFYLFELDAVDSEAPVLNISVATTIFMRGAMNGWDESAPMTYVGNGKSSVVYDVQEIGVQAFKIASSDWSTVDLGSFDEDPLVEPGVEKILAVGAQNLTFDFIETGNYTFVIDQSEPTVPTLIVRKTSLFIRGDMNGWGEADPMISQGVAIFDTDIDLAIGTYAFKVASSDWSTIDLGGGVDDEVVVLAESKNLVTAGANLTLDISTAGIYRFTVTKPNGSKPKLDVSAQ